MVERIPLGIDTIFLASDFCFVNREYMQFLKSLDWWCTFALSSPALSIEMHFLYLFCDRYIIVFNLLFLRTESKFCTCYCTSLKTAKSAYNNTFIAVECKRLVSIWRWDCFSRTLSQKREQLHSSINMLPCNFLLLSVLAALQEDFRAGEVPKISLSN